MLRLGNPCWAKANAWKHHPPLQDTGFGVQSSWSEISMTEQRGGLYQQQPPSGRCVLHAMRGEGRVLLCINPWHVLCFRAVQSQMPGLGVRQGATSSCNEETAACTGVEGARQADK